MRRIGSCILVSVVLLMLVGLVASCGDGSGSAKEKPVKQVTTPVADPPEPAKDEAAQKAEKTTEETKSAEETTGAEKTAGTTSSTAGAAPGAAEAYQYKKEQANQYEPPASDNSSGQYAASEAPQDPTMYLSVPKLGISGALVIDGEAGLESGAMHLSGTGHPWQPGSNTYIAGHRVGFPGTGSDRIFYDLPAMTQGDEVTLQDSNGQAYTYQVSEVFAVTPADTWVMAPTGADTVTLQTCTETPDDWWTIGPSLMASGPESGRLIVRAVRVA